VASGIKGGFEMLLAAALGTAG